MNESYIRSLAPKLVRYFERLANSEPEVWSPYLAVARKFEDLVLQDRKDWKHSAKHLRVEADALEHDGGSAWHEMLLALKHLEEIP